MPKMLQDYPDSDKVREVLAWTEEFTEEQLDRLMTITSDDGLSERTASLLERNVNSLFTWSSAADFINCPRSKFVSADYKLERIIDIDYSFGRAYEICCFKQPEDIP